MGWTATIGGERRAHVTGEERRAQSRSVSLSPAESRQSKMYNASILYIIGRSVSSASNEAHAADVSTATLLATQCITGTCAEDNGCSASGLDAGS